MSPGPGWFLVCRRVMKVVSLTRINAFAGLLSLFLLMLGTTFAWAQEESSGSPASAPSSSGSSSSFGSSSTGMSSDGDTKPRPVDTPAPNALYGVFQMQPQYPTPGTTVMFPEAVPRHLGDDKSVPGRQPGDGGQVYQQGWGESNKPVNPAENKDNPLKGLFQMQPQYPTPGTTVMFPEAVPSHLGDDKSVPGRQPGESGQIYQPGLGESRSQQDPSGNKDNLLKDLFQMQPQYPTPGTSVMFPEAVPAHLGDDSSVRGRQPGDRPAIYQPTFPESESSAPSISAEGGARGEPTAGETKAKEEEAKAELELGQAKAETEKALGEEAKAKDEEVKAKSDIEKGEEDIKKGKAEGDKEEVEKGQAEVAKGKAETAQANKDMTKAKLDEQKAKADLESAKKDVKQAKLDEEKAKQEQEQKKAVEKDETKYEAFHPLREAIQLMSSGQNQKALDLLCRLLRAHPNDAQAYYTRAVLYVGLRSYEQARNDYNTVLKLVPQGELATLSRAGLAKLR